MNHRRPKILILANLIEESSMYGQDGQIDGFKILLATGEISHLTVISHALGEEKVIVEALLVNVVVAIGS